MITVEAHAEVVGWQTYNISHSNSSSYILYMFLFLVLSRARILFVVGNARYLSWGMHAIYL